MAAKWRRSQRWVQAPRGKRFFQKLQRFRYQRNATLHAAAERQCAAQHAQMTTFAHDDASRKRAAQTAKTFMFRGGASSSCEIRTCEEACLILGDQPCIQQVEYVRDHMPPPKY